MSRGNTRPAPRANARNATARLACRCAAALAALALMGCDDFGEKQALTVQAQTTGMRAAGTGGSDESIKQLESIASGSGNSPTVVQAQQSLGQVQLAKANVLSVDLARAQSQAAATVFRIGQLAGQARTSLILADSYRQLDPKVTTDQIADVTGKARGDNNVESYPVDAAKIPSLAIAQQNKSRLDGEVAKTQEAIAAATQERDKALAEAGTASGAIESQKGDERTATVQRIADERAKATLASRQMSDLNATLARARGEQAEQAALVLQLQAAVDSMTAQGASLSEGWKTLTTRADEQTALAKKIFDGDGDGDSVKSLTAALNTQLKEIGTKRDDLKQLYDDSIASFGKAADKAGQRVQELNAAKTATNGGAYEVPAWDRQASLLAVDRMNIDKAAAQKGLADLYAAHAMWLAGTTATTTDVEEVSARLNVGAADPFNSDKLKADLTKAITDADENYDTVVATLEGVSLGTEDLAPLKPTRAMLRIIALSDHADLADLAAAQKVAPAVAAKNAKDKLRDDMKAAAAEARDANVALPALPASLGGTAPAKADDAAATAAPAAPATADSPEVAEVRQSLRDLVTKFTANEVDEAAIDEGLARVKVGDAMKPLLADVRGAIVSFTKLRASVKAKFGDEGVAELMKNGTSPSAAPGMPTKVPTPEEIEQQIAGLKITAVDENTVQIAANQPGGPPAKLVKEEGVWKLDLTELPPQAQMMTGMMGPMVKPIAAAIDQTTADVDAGKLTSVADVKKAMQESIQKTMGAAFGMGGAPAATPATPSDATPAPTPAP